MIRVQGLSMAFEGRSVLENVDFEIGSGQILAVMGSSGGGKTTLLKCLSGLLRPTAGRIEVAGIDVQLDPEGARRKMGLVFQSAALFDYLNVEDNVLFGPRRWFQLDRNDERKLVEEMLGEVGLEGSERLMPSELSGGMRKRVGIARALALRPEVILYDEPTTGLDPVTAYSIDQLIVSARDAHGVTSVVVSHDPTSVVRVADRVAFLEAGRLAFFGASKEFFESRHPAIRELLSKSEQTAL